MTYEIYRFLEYHRKCVVRAEYWVVVVLFNSSLLATPLNKKPYYRNPTIVGDPTMESLNIEIGGAREGGAPPSGKDASTYAADSGCCLAWVGFGRNFDRVRRCGELE